jgi:voltage-gated potassium channel
MPTLKSIIENGQTPWGRAFDLGIQSLIILSLITFSVETLPDLSPTMERYLWYFEVFSILVFSLEYILRLSVARPMHGYALSFFGIVDLLAIAPFFLGAAVDLRTVRTFRLLRFFRIFKLARYNGAIRRFHLALKIAKEEIILFLCATVILLYLAAVGIYYFENEAQPAQFASVFHSLWWAVATLTTVGYGDIYPVTVGGKIFTFFILLVGLGVISVPAGLVASALGKARELEAQIDEMPVDSTEQQGPTQPTNTENS